MPRLELINRTLLAIARGFPIGPKIDGLASDQLIPGATHGFQPSAELGEARDRAVQRIDDPRPRSLPLTLLIGRRLRAALSLDHLRDTGCARVIAGRVGKAESPYKLGFGRHLLQPVSGEQGEVFRI